MRIFDVAVNDKVLLDDLDVWAEAGHDGACTKVVNAIVKGGVLKINFPEVKACLLYTSWFYDKEQWIKYLDMLVENRMNSLYLWNGHPFASLVKLAAVSYTHLDVYKRQHRLCPNRVRRLLYLPVRAGCKLH